VCGWLDLFARRDGKRSSPIFGGFVVVGVCVV
jgi:hypothetical protein